MKRSTHVLGGLCVASLLLLLGGLCVASIARANSAVGWGWNLDYAAGGGFASGSVTAPVGVLGVHEVKEVSASGHKGMALLTNGAVVGWGGNEGGGLLTGDRVNQAKPTKAKYLPPAITQLNANGPIALTAAGNVLTWGTNSYGQVGNGERCPIGKVECGNAVLRPFQVALSGAVQVAAGGGTSVALLANGTVAVWGENKAGQQGNGTKGDSTDRVVPTLVPGLTNVTRIAIGGEGSQGAHVLALTHGTLVGWGSNGAGQLGDGTTVDKLTPVPVAAGLANVEAFSTSVSHTLVLAGGVLYAFGSNVYGELGTASSITCGKGKAACNTIPTPVASASNVSAIAAGFRYSLAIAGGRAFSWGHNPFGQLGDGTLTDVAFPHEVAGHLTGYTGISAGEQTSYAVVEGSGPAPPIEGEAVVGGITVAWKSSDNADPWYVEDRPVTKPRSAWSKPVKLAVTARSYTVTGLTTGVKYEVAVKGRAFGRRTIAATAG